MPVNATLTAAPFALMMSAKSANPPPPMPTFTEPARVELASTKSAPPSTLSAPPCTVALSMICIVEPKPTASIVPSSLKIAGASGALLMMIVPASFASIVPPSWFVKPMFSNGMVP